MNRIKMFHLAQHAHADIGRIIRRLFSPAWGKKKGEQQKARWRRNHKKGGGEKKKKKKGAG